MKDFSYFWDTGRLTLNIIDAFFYYYRYGGDKENLIGRVKDTLINEGWPVEAEIIAKELELIMPNYSWDEYFPGLPSSFCEGHGEV